MKNSQLYKIFSKFDKKTRRLGLKWVQSPVHNTRADLILLYRHLYEQAKGQARSLKKEAVWEAIFPNTPFDEAQMNRLLSMLVAILKEFLAWQEWQEEPADEKIQMVRALKRLGLDEAFETTFFEAVDLLENQPYRDTKYYIQTIELFRYKQEHQALRQRTTTRNTHSDQFEKAGIGLSILNLLRHACMIQNNRNLFKEVEEEPSLSIRLAAQLHEEELADDASLIYFYLWKMLSYPEEEVHFQKARQLTTVSHELFRLSELREIFLVMLNYCIRRVNSGKPEFVRELFALYRSGLEQKALIEDGVLSKFTYKNAISAALGLQEFEWAMQFLEEYQPFLPAKERTAVYTYNKAVIFFRQQSYDQAMKTLREADFGDDVMTSLDARCMLLRMYFEQGYWEALDSLLDSFHVFVKRQKTLGYQAENYLNLIRYVRQLVHTGADKKENLQHLLAAVEASAALAEKKWLLEIIHKHLKASGFSR